MTHTLRLALVPAYLALCLLLGGASAEGFWVNLLLQLLALPILFWALVVRRRTPISTAGRRLLVFALLVPLIVVLQLVPLPPAIWTSLPGRAPVAAGFEMLGQPLPWLPISLAPYDTVSSLLWLLPAFAVLFGIVRLGGFKPIWLAWATTTVTILAVLVGALQITSGDTLASPWYFYEITNFGSATGFFSNANHMATLLVATIPFLAALFLAAGKDTRSTQSASGMFIVLAGAMTTVVVGIFVNFSLAGMGLAVPVLAASALMIFSTMNGKLPSWWALAVIVPALISVFVIFSAPFDNNLTDQDAATSQESRYISFTTSLDAAADFFPAGSGVGTFPDIYPLYETPELVTRTYMNHVHSDYIELYLETGIAGLAVLLVFLLWWGRRAIAIWRNDSPDHFARAASVASAAILAHSLVDYPLRTAAISALFAACCALMSDPRAKVNQRSEKPAGQRARHLSAD